MEFKALVGQFYNNSEMLLDNFSGMCIFEGFFLILGTTILLQ
jgi:hypothetical protein